MRENDLSFDIFFLKSLWPKGDNSKMLGFFHVEIENKI